MMRGVVSPDVGLTYSGQTAHALMMMWGEMSPDVGLTYSGQTAHALMMMWGEMSPDVGLTYSGQTAHAQGHDVFGISQKMFSRCSLAVAFHLIQSREL